MNKILSKQRIYKAKVVLFVTILLLCLLPIVNSVTALLLGFLFSIFIGNPLPKLSNSLIGWMLKISVVGLGFGIDINEALEVGLDGVFLIILTIIFVLIAGVILGKMLKVDLKITYLISSGTAICGGSAISAISPIIGATEKDISISLGVIFLLNSIALLIFPFIGHFLSLTEYQFGLWCAIAIHDTSSVVGAASLYGDEALKVATTVKLVRALWIVPLSFLAILFFNPKKYGIGIPYFIGLYVIALLVNSYLPLHFELSRFVFSGSKALLIATLFVVGSGMSLEKIKSSGFNAMILGLVLWALVSIVSLLLIFIK